MRIEPDIKLDFSDVLIRPKRSMNTSRKEVDLTRTFEFLRSKQKWTGIPIIASNMDTVGTLGTAVVFQKYKMLTWLHKYIPIKDIWNTDVGTNFFAITIGENYYHKIQRPIESKMIRVDAANGYREEFVDSIKTIRAIHPETIIFAGNVCTPEQTEELILAGADVVVVGIGSGGQCLTRVKAGIGYPQLSAVIEAADAAHGLGGHIVSDGGCNTPGDVVKAFGAGADFVALGSMLAGHDENTSEENTKIIKGKEEGGFFKEYEKYARTYGMSSEHAMNKYSGGMADYRSSEGRETWIKHRGPIENTIKDILGGLRSGCSYVGAKKLKELSKRTTFIQVNRTHNTYYEQH